jgi:hypothetical protein
MAVPCIVAVQGQMCGQMQRPIPCTDSGYHPRASQRERERARSLGEGAGGYRGWVSLPPTCIYQCTARNSARSERYQRSRSQFGSEKFSPWVAHSSLPVGTDMAGMTRETVCIVKEPGVTESHVEAMAWNRLRMRGLAPESRPYRQELVRLPNAGVQVWQVSFIVNAR